MNSSKRLLFQGIIWFVIWLILSIPQNFALPFIVENIPVYLFQVGLIAFLIYYAAPQLFVRKRYGYFVFISLCSMLIVAIIIAFIFVAPKGGPPPPPYLNNMEGGLKPPVLAGMTHGFLLTTAYLLGLFVEGVHFLQQKEKETILIKSEALQSELKLLKSQINPHFLFNTLNNIYALAGIDANKTQQSISYLSDMLRYVLYDCERPFVSTGKEVKYLENYIQLFSLKSSKNFPIKLETQLVDPSIEIAPMVLIPFVENAIKHSHVERVKDAFVKIFLKVTKEVIHFEIENNIPKIAINKDSVGGIGLENIRKRLVILYPENHDLEIRENEAIFKIKLIIKPQKDAKLLNYRR